MENIIEQSKKYVNEMLIPLENHYYHEYDHALEVMERAMYLWRKEWLSKEEIEILWLAWLFHDTWFTIKYDYNEFIWAKIARNFLKSMLYPEDKIKEIERLIMATTASYNHPKDILEKIIKDADTDNLWRDDFMDHSNNLRKEIEEIKKIKILNPEWQHWIIKFLKSHKYYTDTQNKERWEKLEENKKLLEGK